LGGKLWKNFLVWKQTSKLKLFTYIHDFELVFKVSWQQNWDICVSLAMKPIIIETLAQAQCLSDWTKGVNLLNSFIAPQTEILNR